MSLQEKYIFKKCVRVCACDLHELHHCSTIISSCKSAFHALSLKVEHSEENAVSTS